MEKVFLEDLGAVDYQTAWTYQQDLMKSLISSKLTNRDLVKAEKAVPPQRHTFLFCEHPHVYTLGKSGSADHLLLQKEGLASKGVTFFKINRGGDITYHGPGQIVGYPILDLDCFFTDVHKYVRLIEQAIIDTLAEYEIEAGREKGFTGVWLAATESRPKRKICAIGVHLSRWVTLHGFAFNVNTDLDYFKYIIPCGINDPDKSVTSMQAELGEVVDIELVKQKVIKHFARLFNFEVERVVSGLEKV